MKLKFLKMEATGNDFIVPINIKPEKIEKFIPFLCERRRGIGADGILFSLRDKNYDFRMIYYNSDGGRAEFCANGARCLIYLNYLKTKKKKFKFIADDGEHEGEYLGKNNVKLKMINPIFLKNLKISEKDYTLINSGVPHLIREEKEIEKIDVVKEGKFLRYHEFFKPKGTNVNFIEITGNKIKIRTYERGVEDEVLSCGTGAVASAFYTKLKNGFSQFEILTKGGDILKVVFNESGTYLIGKVKLSFKGEIDLKF
ncbi:MAG: diaminopimelate epimerase [candidate division WOR-3 bacterium]